MSWNCSSGLPIRPSTITCPCSYRPGRTRRTGEARPFLLASGDRHEQEVAAFVSGVGEPRIERRLVELHLLRAVDDARVDRRIEAVAGHHAVRLVEDFEQGAREQRMLRLARAFVIEHRR